MCICIYIYMYRHIDMDIFTYTYTCNVLIKFLNYSHSFCIFQLYMLWRTSVLCGVMPIHVIMSLFLAIADRTRLLLYLFHFMPYHDVRCWNDGTSLNFWKFSQRVDYGQSPIFILQYCSHPIFAGILAHSLLHRLSTLQAPLSGDTDSSSIAAKSQWNQRRLLWRRWSQKIGWLDSRRWPVMASFSAQGRNTWSHWRE